MSMLGLSNFAFEDCSCLYPLLFVFALPSLISFLSVGLILDLYFSGPTFVNI